MLGSTCRNFALLGVKAALGATHNRGSAPTALRHIASHCIATQNPNLTAHDVIASVTLGKMNLGVPFECVASPCSDSKSLSQSSIQLIIHFECVSCCFGWVKGRFR